MKSKKIFLMIIAIYFNFITSTNANELISLDETMLIKFNDSSPLTPGCNSNTKIGSYTRLDRSAGVLYINCNKNKRDEFIFYKFVDNAGLNRCFGRMVIRTVNLTVSSWYFDGKIKGYDCPNAKKILEFGLKLK
jgi:hypothetical protein